MDKETQLKNYIGLLNFMIFIRWITIIVIGISLTLIISSSREIILVYSIAMFCSLLGIETILTIGISIFKRKMNTTIKLDNNGKG